MRRGVGGNHLGVMAAALIACAGLLCACDGRAPQGGPIVPRACWGEGGMQPGQFAYPRALDSDASSLWIIDKSARVQRCDPVTGDCLGGWKMPEWEVGKPTGVTVWTPSGGTDQDELVLIPDTHYHRVMIYAVARTPEGRIDGTLLTQFGSYGEGESQFIYPTDVCVIPSDDGKSIRRLYVSEYGGHDRVSAFDAVASKDGKPAFEYRFSFGRFGSGAGADPVEFNRPQSVEFDRSKRELVITDACNHRVGRFTLDGRLVKWLGHAGTGPGELGYPYGLSLLGDGTALVAEFGNNRVQRLDLENGACLGIFGQAGHADGQVATPWAVTVLGDRAFVLDSGNNRVIGFDRPRGRPAALSTVGAGPKEAEKGGGAG